MNVGQRSEVRFHEAPKEGHGTYRTWSREIGENRYSFTAVLMPDGERRYSVSRYNGTSVPSFDSAWTRVHFITCKGAQS